MNLLLQYLSSPSLSLSGFMMHPCGSVVVTLAGPVQSSQPWTESPAVTPPFPSNITRLCAVTLTTPRGVEFPALFKNRGRLTPTKLGNK